MPSIAIGVSVCVCLSVFCPVASQKLHVKISPNFLYMLPVAVARSSSDGNARCYVLAVLFSYNEPMRPESKSTRFVHFARWRHRGRSLPFLTASSCCVLQLHLVLFCFSILVERTLASIEAMRYPPPTASRPNCVRDVYNEDVYILSISAYYCSEY